MTSWPLFRVKVCGVTRPEDALVAVDAGADAIGVNFFAGSPRCVDEVAARRLVDAVGGRCVVVGVFVDAPPEQVRATAERVGLTAVQLHGDEAPASVAALAGLAVVRARRLGAEGLADVSDDALACLAAGRLPDMWLADKRTAGGYGGSGEPLDWAGLGAGLAADRGRLQGRPLALAGGLRPETVAGAVGLVRPDAVDVASGVESAPGVKDPSRVRAFVREALGALKA